MYGKPVSSRCASLLLQLPTGARNRPEHEVLTCRQIILLHSLKTISQSIKQMNTTYINNPEEAVGRGH